ncbi:1936_t:CDS:10 [Scutellospora calospora]|uniref:1936_t:CDS:1 n=1 Tax=Scutellospora calospora TaxID=85575 RepID=A0ACA9KRC0_9GLOM|nr:1936_t:CDS:10 [Scutellospora calospora]
MDPLQETVKEIRWNVLEGLSKVARFSRDTAATILEHPYARPILPHLPPVVNDFVQPEQNRSYYEYDAGRVYLAKWASSIADQAEEASRAERSEGYDEGLSERRRRRWSDSEPKRWDEETEVGAFEVLNDDITLPPLHAIRTDPINAEKWFSFFDTEGRLKVELNEVREAVFRGGVENDIRIEVWKFFLGIYPWDSSRVERENLLEAKAQQYWALKREWWDSPEVLNSDDFKEQKIRIEKDVIRTDRTMEFFAVEDMPHPDPLISASSKTTNKKLESMKDILMTYHFYNKDLGYVQGMSDLLAPVFIVMEEEVPAFWAFVGFMEPILDKHRMVIIEYLKQFDEILKYVNDLSMTIPVDETLLRAETLFHQFQRKVEIIDRKRQSVEQDNQNTNGSLRRRVGESVVQNGATDEGSSSDTVAAVDKLPVISDLLRDLLVE